MAAQVPEPPYAARLQVDYPDRDLDRVSSFFRIIWIIPIVVILALITGGGGGDYTNEAGDQARSAGISVAGGLAIATALMILFRQKSRAGGSTSSAN
jgi:hypothetical protein